LRSLRVGLKKKIKGRRDKTGRRSSSVTAFHQQKKTLKKKVLGSLLSATERIALSCAKLDTNKKKFVKKKKKGEQLIGATHHNDSVGRRRAVHHPSSDRPSRVA
jgi:hypothetical protein